MNYVDEPTVTIQVRMHTLPTTVNRETQTNPGTVTPTPTNTDKLPPTLNGPQGPSTDIADKPCDGTLVILNGLCNSVNQHTDIGQQWQYEKRFWLNLCNSKIPGLVTFSSHILLVYRPSSLVTLEFNFQTSKFYEMHLVQGQINANRMYSTGCNHLNS